LPLPLQPWSARKWVPKAEYPILRQSAVTWLPWD